MNDLNFSLVIFSLNLMFGRGMDLNFNCFVLLLININYFSKRGYTIIIFFYFKSNHVSFVDYRNVVRLDAIILELSIIKYIVIGSSDIEIQW
jgi:hypothetical protein